ncbi:Acetone carboxylase beta subunit [Actinomadura madurae]|nr:Acetone carboxylase beta subunit [Actinomadura madurae]
MCSRWGARSGSTPRTSSLVRRPSSCPGTGARTSLNGSWPTAPSTSPSMRRPSSEAPGVRARRRRDRRGLRRPHDRRRQDYRLRRRGTTAKMSVVEDGTPTLTHRFEAGRLDKFKPGSGLPLRLTVVDMIEIGAGGGSIAGLDDLGLLKVGPRSAGSDPGPVAYGPGGTMPTVTDADLVTGRLDPDQFPGGEMSLVGTDVRAALKSHVAEPLGIDVTEAAVGIQSIAADSMAAARGRALRRHGGTRQGAPGRRRRVRRQDRHQPLGRYAVTSARATRSRSRCPTWRSDPVPSRRSATGSWRPTPPPSAGRSPTGGPR